LKTKLTHNLTHFMPKFINKSVFYSALALALTTFTSQLAVAAESECTLNGEPIPCDELWDQMSGFLNWGIGFFILIFAFGIWSLVFWIMMIIHAANNEIQDRGMWIVIMVLTGFIGAVVYYFAVKRNFNKQINQPPSKMVG
jgi:hypothetical protein